MIIPSKASIMERRAAAAKAVSSEHIEKVVSKVTRDIVEAMESGLDKVRVEISVLPYAAERRIMLEFAKMQWTVGFRREFPGYLIFWS